MWTILWTVQILFMTKHSNVSYCVLKISKDWQGGWFLFSAICINLGIYAHPLVTLECDSVWWWALNWSKKTRRNKSWCIKGEKGVTFNVWFREWCGLILQKPKFGVGKNKLRMGIELNTKMKISKYQYSREEMGLIFGVWLWE